MIEVKNLTKYYKGSLGAAVKNASLTAMPGEITVLLGPNGAGKSTTIKSIVNLLSYNGEILICSYPNNSLEAKKQFGYIPEVPVLYDLLTVDESIEFIGKAYRLENYKETGNKYLELFQLTQQRHKLAKELSKGMKQKLSMILALLIGLGSVALGACKERSVFFVELKAARSGIVAGVILGVGRAIGETMAVIMVAGNQAVLPRGLTKGVRTMTANIVLEMGYAAGIHRQALIGTAVVLFFFILVINLIFMLAKKEGR